MKEFLFIINPVSGGRRGDLLRHRLLEALPKRIPRSSYDILLTDRGTVKLPATEYKTVVVAGGDGSIWQTVQKLIQRQAIPKLGIIPVGTANDLARVSGMPKLLKKAGMHGLLKAIERGKTISLDVLKLNEHLFFTNYYGIGVDATVACTINAFREKHAFSHRAAWTRGKFLYCLAGLCNLGLRLPCPVELRYEDERGEKHTVTVPVGSRQIIVTNIPWYAAGAQPSSRCSIDDGLFETTILTSTRHWVLLHLTRFLSIPFDKLLRSGITVQARSLSLHWNGQVHCQLDGETFHGQEPPPHTITVGRQVELIVP